MHSDDEKLRMLYTELEEYRTRENMIINKLKRDIITHKDIINYIEVLLDIFQCKGE